MSNRQTTRSWRVGFFCSCLLLITPGQAAADQPRVLTGHGDAVYDVAFSPAGRLMASGSYDNTVILWSLDDGSIAGKLEGHTDQVFRVAFSPDGKFLATCSGDGTTILWDVAKRERQAVMTGHGDPVIDVAFSTDGRSLATAGSHIQLWQRGQQIWETPHSPLYFAIAFAPNHQSLACGTNDLIRIYSVKDPGSFTDLQERQGMVYQVDYSPDGKWLASASSKGQLSLWDVKQQAKQGAVTADASALFAAAFSPDGTQLITGGRERVIRSWTVPDLELVDERYGPEETVLAVRISPDGKYLATGSYDGKIHLWTLTAGSPENRSESRE